MTTRSPRVGSAVLAGAEVVDVATPAGTGRAHVIRRRGARGTVLLGHGAGGGLRSVDLTVAVTTLAEQGWAVALVEQPWLVAGRRIAPRPPALDEAWLPMVRGLRGRGGPLHRVPGPLVLGGRSAGARVAARTSAALRADAVLCLSFPLHLPGRAGDPARSRVPELARVIEDGRRVAVVQGIADPFGTPAELRAELRTELALPQREALGLDLYEVRGTHTIPAGSAAAVAAAVTAIGASWRG